MLRMPCVARLLPWSQTTSFILATRSPTQQVCMEYLLWFWGTVMIILALRCTCLLWRLPRLAFGSGLCHPTHTSSSNGMI